jgi:hypothetical protein
MIKALERISALTFAMMVFNLMIAQPYFPRLLQFADVFGTGCAYAQGATEIQRTIYFPRLVTTSGTSTNPDDSEYTGIAVANLDSTTATLTFTAYDQSGNLISGTNITNPATRTLNPGEQLPIIDYQIFGPGWTSLKPVGWMKLESTVIKVYAFFLMYNRGLTVLDGADVSPATAEDLTLSEVMDPLRGFTQISIANPNQSKNQTSIYLRKSDGTTKASKTSFDIPANGTMISSLAELFPGVNPEPTDYIDVKLSSRGVIFELLGTKGQVVHGLNGQEYSRDATTLYCPQYVIGGGVYRSILSLMNFNYADSGNATLEFINDEGITLAKKTVPIKAREKIYISDQDFFLHADGLTQGYLKITSDGPPLGGSIVFTDITGRAFSAALPLVSTLQNSMIFSQLASNVTYFTGVAVLNPNETVVSPIIEVFNEKGNLIGSAVVDLLPGQRKCKLLTEIFPDLVGQERISGYFTVRADKALASFALFGTNNYSVLSAIPPQVLLGDGHYNGKWKGSYKGSSNSGLLDVEISGDRVIGFEFLLTLISTSPLSICWDSVYLPSTESYPIQNGSFSFPINEGKGALTTDITGSASSPSEITGTIGTITLNKFRCGMGSWTGTIPAATFKVIR